MRLYNCDLWSIHGIYVHCYRIRCTASEFYCFEYSEFWIFWEEIMQLEASTVRNLYSESSIALFSDVHPIHIDARFEKNDRNHSIHRRHLSQEFCRLINVPWSLYQAREFIVSGSESWLFDILFVHCFVSIVLCNFLHMQRNSDTGDGIVFPVDRRISKWQRSINSPGHLQLFHTVYWLLRARSIWFDDIHCICEYADDIRNHSKTLDWDGTSFARWCGEQDIQWKASLVGHHLYACQIQRVSIVVEWLSDKPDSLPLNSIHNQIHW